MPDNGPETELFSAPFMKEDENGLFVKKSDRFWSVCLVDGKKVIRIFEPETGAVQSNLVITEGSAEWELYSSNEAICANPFAYPLDGLILYYVLQAAGCRVQGAGCRCSEALAKEEGKGLRAQGSEHRSPGHGILIHASAVEYEGRGYLFTGVSGKGKTTISQLWKEAGADVIHDDLLVLTHAADGSIMASSTPLNGNVFARQTRLDAIFLIGHSDENVHRSDQRS